MIPLLKSIVHALLWDELAVRRWFRGLMLTMALSGIGYANQIAGFLGAPRLISAIKLVSVACALIAGVTSVGQKNPAANAVAAQDGAGAP